ncbi:MAG TPA: aconitate hydratase AcnA [Actinomycetota bacterium]|nr:aconitate hydratase AcnA [Actinomycetota bacterium]
MSGPGIHTLDTPSGPVRLHRLDGVPGADLTRLPHTVKILLENLLRRQGSRDVSASDVEALAGWPQPAPGARVAFVPARVLMQDFTGVPAVVDLAALRAAVASGGGDPERVNPLVPVDLVIDHSVQVDAFGTEGAYRLNIDFEYRRNAERYALLRWAQGAFRHFRVVPPGMGICHQVNLEHLSQVVAVRDGVAFPDTLLGTDSHTTMVNGLGVLGWGVGGIEAEAAMLGQPMFLPWPRVVGVRTLGALRAGTTATDLVLTLTEILRARGVVGSFVEFFGAGLSTLRIEDRATLSNMCPEYGATAALFPADRRTLHYLRETGRAALWPLVEAYTKEQGLFRTDDDPDPVFSEIVELDLATVEPSLAGPRRPQDRRSLPGVRASFAEVFADRLAASPPSREAVSNGSVVIASITSCTNTSNPSVMVAAGLLARAAVEAGLAPKPWVKTSMAPGSRVVTDYLDAAGLLSYLDKLGFNLVGYGCTTCIGNSGPLPDEVAAAVTDGDLAVVAVLSGNRNFEGRIHPQVRASYLASPPLVVAYALAGTVDIDLTAEPVGTAADGTPVMLADLWPSPAEVSHALSGAISAAQFEREYGRIFEGDEHWRALPAPTGTLFAWDPSSTYVREPPYFAGVGPTVTPPGDIVGGRVLAWLGDSITTDHISPAGSIKVDSPAGRFLVAEGVPPRDFNSYGARRGNHEVMVRGTFANVRLRNRLAPGTEGPWTVHLLGGEPMAIYEAASRYAADGVPLVVLAGREYGSGSSRDWAAKGTRLLGVRAVIAESYERIHRSNLVGMGVLPLQFRAGESAESLGLSGRETFTIRGIAAGLAPGQDLVVEAVPDTGAPLRFTVTVRVDAQAEVEYYTNGGILPMVLRSML